MIFLASMSQVRRFYLILLTRCYSLSLECPELPRRSSISYISGIVVVIMRSLIQQDILDGAS